MMFPFADTESDDITEEEYVPKEYGIDFKTGQLSGKIVEGMDALAVWCWIALHTPRYRYYIYSDEYGQEFEDLIGKQYSEGYTNSELERMTEEWASQPLRLSSCSMAQPAMGLVTEQMDRAMSSSSVWRRGL